jgi:uncharacterized protein YjbJ (UPF0337 family)
MDEDRTSGTAGNLGGRVEEGVSRVTGDKKTQVQGKLEQKAGSAQDLYGQTADTARDTGEDLDKWLRKLDEIYGQTADAAGNLDKRLRATIEMQPFTMAIVVLGIGWLLGRMRTPH